MIVKSIVFASAIFIAMPGEGVSTQHQAQQLTSAEIQEFLDIKREDCTLVRDLGGGVCEYQCPGIPGTIHALCGTL
ncbi:MAG: hypothetical protein NXH78_01735 [Hyphomonadaceae bacterium]|nr:hypothetical protein [Hyphomonadaceae bacterium]